MRQARCGDHEAIVGRDRVGTKRWCDVHPHGHLVTKAFYTATPTNTFAFAFAFASTSTSIIDYYSAAFLYSYCHFSHLSLISCCLIL